MRLTKLELSIDIDNSIHVSPLTGKTYKILFYKKSCRNSGPNFNCRDFKSLLNETKLSKVQYFKKINNIDNERCPYCNDHLHTKFVSGKLIISPTCSDRSCANKMNQYNQVLTGNYNRPEDNMSDDQLSKRGKKAYNTSLKNNSFKSNLGNSVIEIFDSKSFLSKAELIFYKLKKDKLTNFSQEYSLYFDDFTYRVDWFSSELDEYFKSNIIEIKRGNIFHYGNIDTYKLNYKKWYNCIKNDLVVLVVNHKKDLSKSPEWIYLRTINDLNLLFSDYLDKIKLCGIQRLSKSNLD